MPKSPSRTSKKKKYNARFPPARIKKIMQTDEDVGKVAAAVPVIISRALELFIESLIKETSRTTLSKNAKTLSTSHIKQTIEGNKQFDFLRDLVANVPDHQTEDNNGDAGHHDGEYSSRKGRGSRPRKVKDSVDKLKKGESSKASSDASDEEDEEDDEDTETDEESSLASAAMADTTSISAAAPNAFHNSKDILSSSSTPSSSTSVPRIHVTPPPSVPPSLPPGFTNPGMASLHKQQQQLQPYQQFHQQQQQQQHQQHMQFPHTDGTPDPGHPYYPAFMSNPTQRISSYPLPPQFPNSYPPMPPAARSPTSYPQAHQHQGADNYSDPQHRNQHFHSQPLSQHEQMPQPMNLSQSSPRMSSSSVQHSNDDYDT